ncbi:carboxymuconolactone decarboxylase family protein [Cupriavidus sp. CuC1]|uniref:carboxymuconolactone decarboxylase family protein n=1 Tax=Cupriavidus sp. CuC1 TaxID=3373131 RepID=UPI0037D1FB28
MTETNSYPAIELDDVRAVSPALARYTQDALRDLWQRPALSPRDRSLVTVASLIARSQPIELATHIKLALDNGVTPAELSETITHLAFYSGWANASAVVAIADDIFAERGIRQDQLPSASVELLPIDELVEARRAATVDQLIGTAFPMLARYTTDVLFRDLWLRPGLAPRDRSLVTVAALVTSGQAAQITFHVNKAMDNGLTQEQAAEVITHLAFYAGWPNAMSAAVVAKDVFEKRAG